MTQPIKHRWLRKENNIGFFNSHTVWCAKKICSHLSHTLYFFLPTRKRAASWEANIFSRQKVNIRMCTLHRGEAIRARYLRTHHSCRSLARSPRIARAFLSPSALSPPPSRPCSLFSQLHSRAARGVTWPSSQRRSVRAALHQPGHLSVARDLGLVFLSRVIVYVAFLPPPLGTRTVLFATVKCMVVRMTREHVRLSDREGDGGIYINCCLNTEENTIVTAIPKLFTSYV